MSREFCGSALFLALPDDVFSVLTQSLSPTDICNLGLCRRSLYALVASEKLWFAQCQMLGIVPQQELIEWRKAVSSYKALCRFLHTVRPLLGIWVHQNPELGNVVYVVPSFVSVVGCRIIPQELGPLGIEDGPILWAPVFEIFGDCDGCTVFFLHGREKGSDYLYPGSIKSIDKTCNVLLLEVEPRQHETKVKLLQSKSLDKEVSIKICRSNSEMSRSHRVYSQSEAMVPFSQLAFCHRRMLLEIITSQVRVKVPEPANGPFFPPIRTGEENFCKVMVLLYERRSMLIQMHKLGGGHVDWKSENTQLPTADPTQLELSEVRKTLERSSAPHHSISEVDDNIQGNKKKSLGEHFRNGINQILRKSKGNATSNNSYSSCESRHAQLHEFLMSGDTIGLTLHASTMKLSSYRAWPTMHDSRFALYKLPLRVPTAEQEYSGLWGGTFGWPPGKPTEDKPGKALFFLLLSYDESQGQRLLIATKILEGTHYVLHPNGSAMFTVNLDEPSLDSFPWDSDADSLPVIVEHAYVGEGIANGYGFRYPGAKPGSLFVFHNGHLAFIWKETRAVLTLQRLNLQDLLMKGDKVPALPPIANFSYLTKSYSNVFAGFPNFSNCVSSQRQKPC